MSKEEFVIRGQTASGGTETINFGIKNGYAHRLVEFQLYPSTNLPNVDVEMTASITAGKTAVAPTDVNFNNEGLIATAFLQSNASSTRLQSDLIVINDKFLITQNLILMVMNSAGSNEPVNWQCRFKPVKMSESDIANQNYRQFTIFDE
jgi:hypothetical protein